MAIYIPRDPSRVNYPIDGKSLTIKANPDWPRQSVQPVVYRFANGREFVAYERPGQPYEN